MTKEQDNWDSPQIVVGMIVGNFECHQDIRRLKNDILMAVREAFEQGKKTGSSAEPSAESDWQPIATAPMYENVLVAYHGHGVNQVHEAARVKQTGHWGDWDYINSHDGEPKYWRPLPKPPEDMAGPDCGCDGCTERYHDPDSPDYISPENRT